MKFMDVITLRAVFMAREEGHLPPYLGSTVRGILGHCIREFVCSTPLVKCFKCPGRQECLYVRCFSNTGGEVGAINPYTLYVHTQGKTEWNPGDMCTFDLTLFGRAAFSARIYLDALMKMERKGWGASRLAFQLVSITEPDTGALIYGGKRCLADHLQPHPMRIDAQRAETVLITFNTPLRIVSGGKLFQSLPFDMLVRFLYGRLDRMRYLYGDGEMPWNEEELREKAAGIAVRDEAWQEIDFSRYSMTQKGNRVELPARIGWVMYEGELSAFTGFLQAGRYAHVGKSATIGFGHYELAIDGGERRCEW